MSTEKSWTEIALAVVPALAVVAGLGVWMIRGDDRSDGTEKALNAAMVTVNARLDRIFTKLDDFAATFPVMQEKLRMVQAQIDEAKGTSSSLEARLRAIENNNAANHADIVHTNPKLYPPR